MFHEDSLEVASRGPTSTKTIILTRMVPRRAERINISDLLVWNWSFGNGCVEPCPQCVEAWFGAVPLQLVHVVKECDVGSKGGERSKQQSALALGCQRAGEGAGVGGVHMPVAPVLRDGFEVEIPGENGRR